MKIIKWTAFTIMLLSGLAGISTILLPWIATGFSIPEATSIGIIGGADGPTTIFVAGKHSLAVYGVGVLLVFVASAITWVVLRRKTRQK